MIYLTYIIMSFLLGLVLTPMSKNIAYRYKIVDRPNNILKTHEKATPYMGGLSIYLSFVSSVFILNLLGVLDVTQELLGVIISSTAVFILGIIDDIIQISPRTKLIGQLIAGVIFINFVGKTNLFNNEGIDFIFTLFWLIGMSNAVNLIDIMDGLSAGTVIIMALCLSCILIMVGNIMIGIISLLLAGSCLGFLKYNFNPAKIFMGDAGSLFIGFIVGTIPVIAFWNKPDLYNIMIPILICIVPIGETIFLMIIRIKEGKSILLGSRDHFAIRLQKIGYSVNQITLITYCFSFIIGVSNIWIYFEKPLLLKNIVIAFEIILMLLVGIFLSKIDMTIENNKLEKKYL